MKKILLITSLLGIGAILGGCSLIPKESTSTTNNNNTSQNQTYMDHSTHNGSNNTPMDHSIASEEEFIVNMIPHHQEAVDSAKIVLAKSTNNEVRVLAQNIIDAQTKEITMMQGRMKSWYPNSTIKSNYENMMPDMSMLSGAALDKAFLDGMIDHHEGAIQMAKDVLEVQHRSEVMTLAGNIIATQTEEIQTMQKLLK